MKILVLPANVDELRKEANSLSPEAQKRLDEVLEYLNKYRGVRHPWYLSKQAFGIIVLGIVETNNGQSLYPPSIKDPALKEVLKFIEKWRAMFVC